jgi:hypothetical protein
MYDDHMSRIPGTETLEKRVTKSYVGSWKHLDRHEYVGSMTVEASSFVVNEEEEEEPMVQTLFLRVWSPREEKEIREALYDHFTVWGCDHEHDCCGCRSYRCSSARRIGGSYWKVIVTSSRNY